MWCEISISGPRSDLNRLTGPLADLPAQVDRCRPARPGRARLSWLVEEEKLDVHLILLSRILDEVEQQGPSDFTIRVRNLQGSEPPAGSDQFVEKFRPIPRLTIQPWNPDRPGPPAPATVVLDPDSSFGTGKHPSTRLCLQLLDRIANKRKRAGALLDLGCGTGVLAIGALKLGAAATALAVDIDPEAVRVASGNVELNGLAGRITVRQGSWAAVTGRFDLIVANLVPSVLLLIGAHLSGHLRGDGSVVVAGFRTAQAEMMADFLRGQDLRVRGRVEQEGWTALRLVPGDKM